jgi:spore coat polysaccharide biosynthesis protein SpsF
MSKVVFITQARMGSTRLPGKIMNKYKGKPVLYWFMKRAFNAKSINQFVIATTTNNHDNEISDFVNSEFPEVHVTRGNEEDVLSRYAQAADETNADIIVRVTSDCPFLDWQLVDSCVERFKDEDCDALRTLRSNLPIGLDVEVFSRKALNQANEEAVRNYDREHVGPYIFDNEDIFKIHWYKSMDFNWPKCRLTLDYPEDLELVKYLYEKIGPLAASWKFGQYLSSHPEVAEINLKYSK